MRKLFVLAIMCIFNLGTLIQAQTPTQTQTIKGQVLDKDTKQPLIGATIEVLDLESTLGTVTEFDGSFSLANVPVGRRKIVCSYVGYTSYQSDNIILSSAKELVLNIELIEAAILTDEVVVTAYQKSNQAINEMAVLSARSFSVEETQRYAASGNDPGRMAMAFPGVQPARDSRSDIVIRGNSSVGMGWRLEGVDIPNPNHFARRGSSGGGITIFSISMLGNSDFTTGAFPAEYGNAFSGVFDMKFRKGNRENREHTFRAGILGLDFSTEGPIKKGKSSYLVNYRYSTLGILNSMGIHLVSPRVGNTFQDLSFNLNFPSENNKSIIGVWGIGGLSKEEEMAEEGIENWKSYSDKTTYDFETNMGAMGINYTYLLDDKSYIKTSLAGMGQQVVVKNDTLNVEMQSSNVNTEDFINNRFSLSSFYNRKINSRLNLKTGITASSLIYNLRQDSLQYGTSDYRTILDASGNTLLLQPFAQVRYRPTQKLSVNVGLHALYLDLNQTSSLEPRLGIQYQVNEKQSFSLAYGLHGRIVPLGSYFTEVEQADGSIALPNQDLKMIKSHHFIAAYDLSFKNNLRLHTEVYHQRLFNVPVVNDINRTYWLLNDIQGYASEALVSEGTGTNTGLDISLEKYFDKSLFFLLSGSIFESTYEALDKDKTFNTQYNSNYTATFMGGKEWSVSEKGIFQTAIKILYNGGLRITPLDETITDVKEYDPPEDESRAFSEQIPAYFRPDIRLAYRQNNPNNAWSISLDIQNAINRRNIDGLNRTYDPDLSAWVYREQSALVPILAFQIDF